MKGSSIIFDGGGKDTNWSPGANSGTAIVSGYTQGSKSITLGSATGYSASDYISIYQSKDSAVIDDKGLKYLGEDCGSSCTDPHVMQQYSKITAVSGNTLSIDPPIFYVTPSATGQAIRKQTFNMVMAGVENLRLNGDGTNYKTLWFSFTRNCWVKGVETYNAGGCDSSGSPHIWTDFSYGNEYRDGYHHHGSSNDSGRNYGLEFYNWNTGHKIENNIVRDVRHSIVFEGGGSGNGILCNYTDDSGESVDGQGTVFDTAFLGEDAISNHGSHPYMNLWEGNSVSSWWGDYTQGSSSHVTLYRNHVRCKNTALTLQPNPWLWVCVEVEKYNRYYNLVGNVIGVSSFVGGSVVDDGNNSGSPTIYRFGYSSAGGSHADAQPYATVFRHGNYNYVSKAVDKWENASQTLSASLYYASKPAFFGSCAWPPFGPDLGTLTGTLPAKDRYEGGGLCW
jgi:hypothetical protein